MKTTTEQKTMKLHVALGWHPASWRRAEQKINAGRVELPGGRWLERLGRDWPVTFSDGLGVIAGEFAVSAGSLRHPAIGPVRGVVLELPDVPYDDAVAALVSQPEYGRWVEAAPGELDVAELEMELNRLNERRAVLFALLGRGERDYCC